MPEFDDDALLTKKQLARALNTSERTIQRWVAAGDRAAHDPASLG